jgi:lipid II isoglutaminyl synthase (glutamine-hydrolysing)
MVSIRAARSLPAVPRARSGGLPLRTRAAVLLGAAAARASRRLGLGAGAVVGGRIALALDSHVLSRLAAGRRIALVSGTNGKTTTAHMLAAALRTQGPVAHNATGANMPDGVVAALMAQPAARDAVFEVDELHLGPVMDAVRPAVVVLLNFTRDQLDRGSEVRAVASRATAALGRHPETLVVANADDPLLVAALGRDRPVRWVAAGTPWLADAGSWGSAGGAPRPAWRVVDGGVEGPGGKTALRLQLPGPFNQGNAALAVAAADALGVPPERAAGALAALESVAGRYAVVRRGAYVLHLLLAKNPAGWAGVLPMLRAAPSLLLVINAREADGRDTSWLWDVPFEQLPQRPIVASGERAADLGLRLSYAGLEHRTEPDPVRALDHLPPGEVHVVANYTAFNALTRRLAAETAR